MSSEMPSVAFKARRALTDSKIVGRFARRNVLLQNGVFVSSLKEIVSDGDSAMAELKEKFSPQEQGLRED